MIKVISLKTRITENYTWAQVTAKTQFQTAIGSRQVPRNDPYSFTKAVHWAQLNAINQLKDTFV